MSRIGRYASLLLMFVVAACAPNQGTFSRSTAFTAKSQNALVVIGVYSNIQLSARFGLAWWRFDPATRSVSLGDNDGVKIVRDAFWTGAEAVKPRYLVFSVPPGNYAMVQASAITTMNFSADVPSFSVKPGEVIYVGDYQFVFPWKPTSRLGNLGQFLPKKALNAGFKVRHTGYNLPAAQNALKNYGNVKGSVQLRRIKRVTLDE